MAQHTAGPWEPFDVDGSSADEPTVFSKKHCLATVWINDISQEQAIANAKLMAAAPDMLAALKLVSGLDIFHEALSIVDAAIAKAEGRS